MAALSVYSYPGNVRELENIWSVPPPCTSARVEVDDLQLAPPLNGDGEKRACCARWRDLDDYMNRIERQLILDALSKTGANRTAAARSAWCDFPLPALSDRALGNRGVTRAAGQNRGGFSA